MHKLIFMFNSVLLTLIVTHQWWFGLCVGIVIAGRELLITPCRRMAIGYVTVMIASIGYTVWLAHLPLLTSEGEQQLRGLIITQIQTQQPYFQQFVALQHLKPWVLSWYGKHLPLQLGECWYFKVHVKMPHPLRNPHQLFLHAIPLLPKLKGNVMTAERCNQQNFLQRIAAWRQKIDQEIIASRISDSAKQMVRALGIGRQDQLTSEQWRVLQRTGTAHLFAISGLHLTTMALLIYSLANLLGWVCPRLYLWLPRPKLNLLIASLFGIMYSLLVGFSLPIQRALVMLMGCALARFYEWRMTTWELLQCCILLFLFIQPSCALLPSFWLSFISVGILRYAFQRRVKPYPKFSQWWRGLWATWLGTLGLNILFFQQISLVAPLANAVAIPMVTLVVVPLILIGIGIVAIIPQISEICWWLGDWVMQALWLGLTKLAAIPWAAVSISHYYIMITILSMIGALLYLLPRYLVYCQWGWWLLLLGFCNKPPAIPAGEFMLELLDVGQGLAVVIRTQHHVLLYDTGPRYLNFDVGRTVIVPYLHWLAVKQIDRVIISHWDSDHSGGLLSIMAAIPTRQLLSSDAGHHALPLEYCQQGMEWYWDQVKFSFLYPSDQLLHLGNNSSCVLQIAAGQHKVLLPGDIEAFAEKVLLENDNQLPSQILIAPHHGSSTSSTMKFIRAVHPLWVLFPVGWQNRFHLPKPQVMERYRALPATILRTDEEGAIRFHISPTNIELLSF